MLFDLSFSYLLALFFIYNTIVLDVSYISTSDCVATIMALNFGKRFKH